jgi:hypothetical protein
MYESLCVLDTGFDLAYFGNPSGSYNLSTLHGDGRLDMGKPDW